MTPEKKPKKSKRRKAVELSGQATICATILTVVGFALTQVGELSSVCRPIL